MKSRTFISFCQKPGSNPSQDGTDFLPTPSREIVGTMMVLLTCRPLTKLSTQSEQRPRVPRDHQLLVGRDYPRRDLASRRGDSRAAAVVRLGVEFYAEPARSLADARAYLGRVLANACGEDQPVHAAQHGGQRADLP